MVAAGVDDPLLAVAELLPGKITVLLGHSGVGKSTLVNRLVPEADRAVGEVTDIGRGRHTSTQSVALPLGDSLPGSGWVIDTPGIRSFGLAHIQPDDVLMAFSDLAEAIEDCPRGCGHMGPPADPECALDALTGPARRPRRRGPAAAGGAQSQTLTSRMPSSSGGTRCPSVQRISTFASAPQPRCVSRSRLRPGRWRLPPLEHRPHHRHEFDAGVGEHILVAAALPGLAVGPPRQQPELDQFGQPRRGGGLGDAHPAGEVVEPGGAVVRLAHDQHRGLGADDRHGLLDRALADRRPCVAVGQRALQQCHANHLPVWVAFSIPRCLPGYS